MTKRKKPEELCSQRWFGPQELRSFGHRSRALQMGYTHEDYKGKPVIAIVNTWSDVNHCHSHLRERAQEVKRGYGKIFAQHIKQANLCCDFDFLEGTTPTPEPEIH